MNYLNYLTDLRVGNWVKSYIEVGHWYYVRVTKDDLEGNYKCFYPIKITEEILLKFGAISNCYQDRYELGNIHIQCDKTKGITELWIEEYPNINYLHQLQNLYYIKNNIELDNDKINLNI